MIDAKGSMVVGGQGSHDRLSGVPVVPARGGRGEDALQHPHGDAGDRRAAVLFKVEWAFAGLVDRFNALPYRTKQATTRPCRFAAVRGSHDGDTPVAEPGFGVTVAVALVHHQN